MRRRSRRTEQAYTFTHLLGENVGFEDLIHENFYGSVRCIKPDFLEIHRFFDLPYTIKVPHVDILVDSRMALYIFMNRLVTGTRHHDLAIKFSMPVPTCGKILENIGDMARRALTLKPL